MGIPPALSESLHDPVFWARYTFAHEDGPGADRLGDIGDMLDDENGDVGTALDVGGGCRIVLAGDRRIDFYSLGIVVPDSTGTVGLGWDDLAHWHPYALRWSELDLICQAISALDPRLPHPGAPLALMCRFAAVFDDDDVDQAVAAVDAAYASLRPQQWNGYWPRGTDWLGLTDFRGQNVLWHRDQAGNLWARQADEHEKDFYSTRVQPEDGRGHFPQAELQMLLAMAAITVKTGTT